MSMISIISENDTFYSAHTDEVEAEAYLENLRKRWPLSSWDVDRVQIGVRRGQGKLIWAGTGTYYDGAIINFNRAWIFEGELSVVRPTSLSGMIPLKFRSASINDFVKEASNLLGMKCSAK